MFCGNRHVVYNNCIKHAGKEMISMAGEWNMATIIAVIAVAVVLFFAIRYIVKEKRKGVHCIGCPMAGSCTEAYKEMERDMRECLKRRAEEDPLS